MRKGLNRKIQDSEVKRSAKDSKLYNDVMLPEIDFQNLTESDYKILHSYLGSIIAKKYILLDVESRKEIAHHAIVYLYKHFDKEKSSIGNYIQFAIKKGFEIYKHEGCIISKWGILQGRAQTSLTIIGEDGMEYDNPELPFYHNTEILELESKTNLDYVFQTLQKYLSFRNREGFLDITNAKKAITKKWNREFFLVLARKSKREIRTYFNNFFNRRKGNQNKSKRGKKSGENYNLNRQKEFRKANPDYAKRYRMKNREKIRERERELYAQKKMKIKEGNKKETENN